MKLLNLDQLTQKASRQVTIRGKQYDVVPMSVSAFVTMTKEAEEYVKAGVVDPLREVEMVVDVVSECIPDAPRAVLESLNLDQLHVISNFVRGEDVDGAEDVEGNA